MEEVVLDYIALSALPWQIHTWFWHLEKSLIVLTILNKIIINIQVCNIETMYG